MGKIKKYVGTNYCIFVCFYKLESNSSSFIMSFRFIISCIKHTALLFRFSSEVTICTIESYLSFKKKIMHPTDSISQLKWAIYFC